MRLVVWSTARRHGPRFAFIIDENGNNGHALLLWLYINGPLIRWPHLAIFLELHWVWECQWFHIVHWVLRTRRWRYAYSNNPVGVHRHVCVLLLRSCGFCHHKELGAVDGWASSLGIDVHRIALNDVYRLQEVILFHIFSIIRLERLTLRIALLTMCWWQLRQRLDSFGFFNWLLNRCVEFCCWNLNWIIINWSIAIDILFLRRTGRFDWPVIQIISRIADVLGQSLFLWILICDW